MSTLSHVVTAPADSRVRRMAGPGVTLGGLGLACLALHLRDPHQQGSWGVCPVALLGLSCPGCGGLRAVNDLTDLRLADAASSNLALVVLAPIVVFLLGRWTLDRWRGQVRPAASELALRGLLLAAPFLVAFTVLRNLPLPLGEWLAP